MDFKISNAALAKYMTKFGQKSTRITEKMGDIRSNGQLSLRQHANLSITLTYEFTIRHIFIKRIQMPYLHCADSQRRARCQRI